MHIRIGIGIRGTGVRDRRDIGIRDIGIRDTCIRITGISGNQGNRRCRCIGSERIRIQIGRRD